MPFTIPNWQPGSTGLTLRVETQREFRLLTDFTYTLPAAAAERIGNAAWFTLPSGAGLEVEVPAGPTDPQNADSSAGITDLATVPPLLWGLVASYGQHTLAAILHDYLCRVADTFQDPEDWWKRRRTADEVFWQALRDPGASPFHVPFLRSALLWGGVSAARYFRFWRSRVVLALVAVSALMGFVLLWYVPPFLPRMDDGAGRWLWWLAVLLGSLAFLIAYWRTALGSPTGTGGYESGPVVRAFPLGAGVLALLSGWLLVDPDRPWLLPVAVVILAVLSVWVGWYRKRHPVGPEGIPTIVIRWVGCAALSLLSGGAFSLMLGAAARTDQLPRLLLVTAATWLITGAAIMTRSGWSRDLFLPVITAVALPAILPILVLTALASLLLWVPDVITGDPWRTPISRTMERGSSLLEVRNLVRWSSSDGLTAVAGAGEPLGGQPASDGA